MLKKLFGSRRAAEVQIPLNATMVAVVRRFQGTFECGCSAHPLDEPHHCPVHNTPRYYIAGPTMDGRVRINGA